MTLLNLLSFVANHYLVRFFRVVVELPWVGKTGGETGRDPVGVVGFGWRMRCFDQISRFEGRQQELLGCVMARGARV